MVGFFLRNAMCETVITRNLPVDKLGCVSVSDWESQIWTTAKISVSNKRQREMNVIKLGKRPKPSCA